jgi:hypothetical protein
LTTGFVTDVLVELLLGAATEIEGWVTTGIEASSLVDLIDTKLVVGLDLIVVADLGLVEVRLEAGITNVDVGTESVGSGADVGEETSSDTAEPSSVAEVVAAGSSVATGEVVSEDPASPVSVGEEPESSPPESDPD